MKSVLWSPGFIRSSFCLSVCLFFLRHLSTLLLQREVVSGLGSVTHWRWKGAVTHLQHVVMFQAAAVIRLGFLLIRVKNVTEFAEEAALGDDVADAWAADTRVRVSVRLCCSRWWRRKMFLHEKLWRKSDDWQHVCEEKQKDDVSPCDGNLTRMRMRSSALQDCVWCENKTRLM